MPMVDTIKLNHNTHNAAQIVVVWKVVLPNLIKERVLAAKARQSQIRL
jgi:hypothetical protein